MNARRSREHERREAERARIIALNTPVAPGPDGKDHGMDLGPAALARPSSVVLVGGKIRGAGQRKAAPVYARMIDASTMFERLNALAQISDRQAKAGHRLIMLRHAGGVDRSVTARYTIVRETVEETLQEGDPSDLDPLFPEGFDALTYYRWLLRRVGSEHAEMLEAACCWTPENRVGNPGESKLATFQVGLDKIADLLGLKRK